MNEVSASASLAELFNRAFSLQLAGQVDAAQSLYRQIIQIDPWHAHSLHSLGAIAFERKQHREALDLFQRAVQARPDEAVFHNSLGVALQACGLLNDALLTLRAATRTHPEFIGGWRSLLNVLGALDLGQGEEARQVLDQITRLETSKVNELNELGLKMVREQRLQEACNAFRAGIACNPNVPTLYHNLGNVLTVTGQLDEALTCLAQALRLAPSSAEVYRSLGNTLAAKGRFAEAIAAFEQALKLQPGLQDVQQAIIRLRPRLSA